MYLDNRQLKDTHRDNEELTCIVSVRPLVRSRRIEFQRIVGHVLRRGSLGTELEISVVL